MPSTRFAVEPVAEQALRVSLGGVAEHAALEAALRVLAGHVAAALKHHFIDKDDILVRILPDHGHRSGEQAS